MITHFLKSLTYAVQGFHYVIKEEKNFFIQSILAILVIAGGWKLEIEYTEWFFIIFAIVLVLGSEILNTILEDICDEIEPNHHPVVGKVKDMMAAFVLLNSCAAIIIGLLIFLPRLF